MSRVCLKGSSRSRKSHQTFKSKSSRTQRKPRKLSSFSPKRNVKSRASLEFFNDSSHNPSPTQIFHFFELFRIDKKNPLLLYSSASSKSKKKKKKRKRIENKIFARTRGTKGVKHGCGSARGWKTKRTRRNP